MEMKSAKTEECNGDVSGKGSNTGRSDICRVLFWVGFGGFVGQIRSAFKDPSDTGFLFSIVASGVLMLIGLFGDRLYRFME